MINDQTALWEQFDLGRYCLQYTTKVHKETREQTTIVLIDVDEI